MLALAYSNDTLDIYGGAACYMFYRFFEYGVGMIWVRIILPEDFDYKQISALFNSLKIDQQTSFDYWSSGSKLHEFSLSKHFRELNKDLNYWCNKSLKLELIPRYQVRSTLLPVVVYNEPILFERSTDQVITRVHRNWLLSLLFASRLRDTLAVS
jgi:hypothetical protein